MRRHQPWAQSVTARVREGCAYIDRRARADGRRDPVSRYDSEPLAEQRSLVRTQQTFGGPDECLSGCSFADDHVCRRERGVLWLQSVVNVPAAEPNQALEYVEAPATFTVAIDRAPRTQAQHPDEKYSIHSRERKPLLQTLMESRDSIRALVQPVTLSAAVPTYAFALETFLFGIFILTFIRVRILGLAVGILWVVRVFPHNALLGVTALPLARKNATDQVCVALPDQRE